MNDFSFVTHESAIFMFVSNIYELFTLFEIKTQKCVIKLKKKTFSLKKLDGFCLNALIFSVNFLQEKMQSNHSEHVKFRKKILYFCSHSCRVFFCEKSKKKTE